MVKWFCFDRICFVCSQISFFFFHSEHLFFHSPLVFPLALPFQCPLKPDNQSSRQVFLLCHFLFVLIFPHSFWPRLPFSTDLSISFSPQLILTCTSCFCIYLPPLRYERTGAPPTLWLPRCPTGTPQTLNLCLCLCLPSLSQRPWSRWLAPWPKWSCRITCATWCLLCSTVTVNRLVTDHQ